MRRDERVDDLREAMLHLDPHVRAELDELGLTEDSYRAILLLPLVEVAWVDGVIQPEEREAILAYGAGSALLDGGAREVVEQWLKTRPDHATFARGRAILVELAHTDDAGAFEGLDDARIEDVVEHCRVVAESAGGLFGRFFTASDAEQEAIRQIGLHIAKLTSYYTRPRRQRTSPGSSAETGPTRVPGTVEPRVHGPAHE